MNKLTKTQNPQEQDEYYQTLVQKTMEDISGAVTPDCLKDMLRNQWLKDINQVSYPFPGPHTVARILRDMGFTRKLVYVWEKESL